ncbi:hypothetical protein KG830_002019 [Salmonella enterica]|uniref:hypothetical protein n=1 Tax=Salmonella enterica TaxID=28901 RepID=UPI0003BD107D|nr:hypothetical protein [Salmonella enterica]EGF6396367.1 hypothetical protein [Salmonella enterica subsp. enterica serovar Rottnest]ESH29698.1 hypothetical protein SEEGA711_02823 [Salmonella enterica subsp. enterica serovar Gaminara str. ATCC BAA-711]MIE47605.1 hypothetical protein [Salmonella enterica subsp. enterica]HBJ6830725.1 hypothetical protein [Salmonella enterica subsp. arizonae serovar 56:z4,z23:-]EAB4958759.1 hypothetical protein [Salmonella enterica]
MDVTKEDAHTISEYLRAAHGGYSGPVFIDINRLVDLNMACSRLVVMTYLMKQQWFWRAKQ